MKVLFVSELWPPQSGTFVFEQIRALVPHVAATVVVLVPHAPNWPRYRFRRSPLVDRPLGPGKMAELGEEVPIYYLRYRTIPELGRYLNSMMAQRALVRFLRNQKGSFDLIHAHFAYIAGFAAARSGQRFGIPVIVTAYGSDVHFYTRRTLKNLAAAVFTIWGLRHADSLTVVSEDLKRKLITLGIPEHRITVVSLAIRATDFFPRGEGRSLRQQLRLSETAPFFLFVGNLVPVKGLEFLLDALWQVCRQLPEAKLVMIGSGEQESTLQQRAHALGIDQHVIWIGRKPHHEIPIWMSAASFLVLPSLSEGYPNVILEALACGTPVIASRVGGVSEILISPEFGVMVPPRDSAALAQAMLDAVGKHWDTKKLVEYAHENTWTERAQRFLKVYQNVLKAEGVEHRA